MANQQAILLLSGGLDSTTVAGLLRREGRVIHALSFAYGQRHQNELDYAHAVAQEFQVASHRILSIDLGGLGGSALTDSSLQVPESGVEEGIPITYVPARNTVFLSYALALAEVLTVPDIYVGVNSQDYSGYPDCRPAFIEAFARLAAVATRLGVEGESPRIHAPLQYLRKAEIIRAGLDAGVDYGITRSCYQLDAAGRSCGRCDACRLRLAAFAELGLQDPAPYR